VDDVKLDVITTKSGDNGKTNLVNELVLKCDEVVELIGTIDEANASIGSATAAVSVESRILEILKIVQSQLFDLSADIIRERQDGAKSVKEKEVELLERWVEELNSELPPLKSFVIPKGRSAPMHFARTVVRRAERCFWSYTQERISFDTTPGIYLNRLSDLLFVICRYIHNKSDVEEIWIYDKNLNSSGGSDG
jgi:cob(I)alamin adenosyltransferase